MIVHIGYGVCVNSEDVIAILDKKSAMSAPQTAALLARLQAEGRVIPCEKAVQSYVLFGDKDSLRVAESVLRGVTLRQRFLQGGLQE